MGRPKALHHTAVVLGQASTYIWIYPCIPVVIASIHRTMSLPRRNNDDITTDINP
ncbi:hypothetical protein BDW71DRAFT_17889 [Aspergillus fruticulosus]